MTALPSSSYVRTTLIHRRHIGPKEWWHWASICTLTCPLDAHSQASLSSFAIDIGRLGFTAISVNPTRSFLLPEQSAPAFQTSLADFIATFHRVGVKVIVSLSSDTSADEGLSASLISLVDAALWAGADGIDLGLVPSTTDDASSHDFSRMVAALMAEIVDQDSDAIITAHSPVADPAVLKDQLAEDWFHHLRDSSLVSVSWNASHFARRVAQAYEVRDPLGLVPSWTWTNPKPSPCERYLELLERGESPELNSGSNWDTESNTRRRDAVALYTTSLPGAHRIPWLSLGGIISIDEDQKVSLSWDESVDLRSRHLMISHAHRLRTERRMGTGSYALVTGLDWMHKDVSVHITAGVMVVFNTSNAPVRVPAEHAFLVSSVPTVPSEDGSTVVESDSCAWFDTARVMPAPSPFEV